MLSVTLVVWVDLEYIVYYNLQLSICFVILIKTCQSTSGKGSMNIMAVWLVLIILYGIGC